LLLPGLGFVVSRSAFVVFVLCLFVFVFSGSVFCFAFLDHRCGGRHHETWVSGRKASLYK
jgi:hypothetical protein